MIFIVVAKLLHNWSSFCYTRSSKTGGKTMGILTMDKAFVF